VPQNFPPFDTFGKYVFVTGAGESESQTQMAEDEQYRLYYDAVHQQPGEMSPSTIPEFLENTVELAAAAYALYTYALKHEHQALTDMASARTALSSISHNNMATALTATGTQLAAAATALGKINGDGARTYLTDADSALDLAVTALGKVTTYLENNTNEDAKFWLTKITTDIASLRTAIVDAQNAANSELDAGDFSAVATHLGSAATALLKVITYLEANTNENSKY